MVIYTVGHSTHTAEDFLRLLAAHQIDVVADVRSRPYSHYNPHFNRDALKNLLHEAGVRYLFLGRELGGNPRTWTGPWPTNWSGSISGPGPSSRRGWHGCWTRPARTGSACSVPKPTHPGATGVSYSLRNLKPREPRYGTSWRMGPSWTIGDLSHAERRSRARDGCFNQENRHLAGFLPRRQPVLPSYLRDWGRG